MEIGPVGKNEIQRILVETTKPENGKKEFFKSSGFNIQDSVEISLAAKKKIGELAHEKLGDGIEITPNEPENREEKLNIVRLRISQGFYGNRGVIEKIADLNYKYICIENFMATTTIDNKVRQTISNIRNLPTPPIVFHQIQKVINDPNVSANQIASILSEDPAMSVKVLKLTNSAFYGLSREVDSVRQAVVIVGLEAIKNLILSASVLEMFKGKDIDPEFQEKHWRHSLATGFCCRIIARQIKEHGFIDADAAFSTGLLHDIGKMVVICFLEEERKLLKEAREKDPLIPDYILEQNTIGFNHAQVGGFLTEYWKLPPILSEAINFHHAPQDCEAENQLCYMLNLSNYIAKKTFFDEEEMDKIEPVSKEVLDYLQLNDESILNFSEQLKEEYLKAETFMQMAGLA